MYPPRNPVLPHVTLTRGVTLTVAVTPGDAGKEVSLSLRFYFMCRFQIETNLRVNGNIRNATI